MKEFTITDLIFLIGWFFAILAVTSWALSPNRVLSNEIAVLIEVSIALMLAAIFFFIQNSNNNRRKQFWANEAISELHAIMSAYSVIRNKYQVALSNANQNEVVGEVTIDQAVEMSKSA